MIRQVKHLLVLGCACAVWTGLPRTSEAGIIPWVYDAIFGPVGSQQAYWAGFRGYPTYGAGYGYAGYAPAAPLGGFGLGGCAPCGGYADGCSSGACGFQAQYGPALPCSDCGLTGCAGGNCSLGTCVGGQCGLANCAPTSGTNLSPTPDNGIPRTYNEEAPRPGEGFAPREPGDTDGFGPATLERPESPPTTIPRREPAPTRPMIDEEPAPGEAGTGPTLNLDDKVAWRPAPARKRLNLRPGYTSAKITREVKFPKTGWEAADTKVANNK